MVDNKIVVEVKSQRYTNQLKDYNLYAQEEGYEFSLYVRKNTKLSKKLIIETENGKIKIGYFEKNRRKYGR